MYRLEFLPSARNDLVEIVQYISSELGNPSAAYDLADELIAVAEKMAEFPYASPAHTPIRPLKHEYRRGRVKNYYLFYWVDEKEKCVTLARVIYARRDYDRELSWPDYFWKSICSRASGIFHTGFPGCQPKLAKHDLIRAFCRHGLIPPALKAVGLISGMRITS